LLLDSVGWEAAEQALAAVLREVRPRLRCYGRRLTKRLLEVLSQLKGAVVRGACLGLSGVDREMERERWTTLAAKLLGPQCAVRVANDAVIALAAGTGGVLEGVVVISGTGTIALGIGIGGTRVRCQGWGPLLGDRGEREREREERQRETERETERDRQPHYERRCCVTEVTGQ
jgi:hypothetical protein